MTFAASTRRDPSQSLQLVTGARFIGLRDFVAGFPVTFVRPGLSEIRPMPAFVLGVSVALRAENVMVSADRKLGLHELDEKLEAFARRGKRFPERRSDFGAVTLAFSIDFVKRFEYVSGVALRVK
jgi:hypothetical protein